MIATEESKLINYIETTINELEKIILIEIEDYDDVFYKIKIAVENYRKEYEQE
jgi:hypothetical protein